MLLFLLTLLNEKTLLFRSCQQESLKRSLASRSARHRSWTATNVIRHSFSSLVYALQELNSLREWASSASLIATGFDASKIKL